MIQLSKLADYGIVMLTHMARGPGGSKPRRRSLREPSTPAGGEQGPQGLAHAGLLASHRGAKGGYGLSRPAEGITVAE